MKKYKMNTSTHSSRFSKLAKFRRSLNTPKRGRRGGIKL